MQAVLRSSIAPQRISAPVQRNVAVNSSSHVFNVEVVVGDSEPQDAALRRFRRAVQSAAVVDSCRRRRYFENTQDMRKRKVKEAAQKRKMRGNVVRTMDQVTFADNGPFGDLYNQNDSELLGLLGEQN